MAVADVITVPRVEWERLLKLEADLPMMLATVRAERDAEKLRELHQRDKENPAKHRARALKSYNRNKDAINAKRREAYRRKLAAAPQESVAPTIESNES